MESIAKFDREPSPQTLVGAYPLVILHHWFFQAQWQVTRMKGYLESCQGPTPVAEELRQIYLDVLRDCDTLLQVSLSPELAAPLAQEEACLLHACQRQRTHKGGLRRRTSPVTAAAD